jgi:hypothetical protein
MLKFSKNGYGKAFILVAIFSMLVLPQSALAETDSSTTVRVKIVDFSKEMKDGQLIVTAKVENGAEPGGAGMVVVGYDGDGNPIETGSNGGSMSNRETRKLSVTLHAGGNIKGVKVFPAGNGPKDRTIVLSQGVRKVDGELIVTGVVEVGSNQLQNSGIAAVGLDRLGKAVAMDIAQSIEGYNGGHWAQTYEIKLPGDVGIEQVKLFPIGDVSEGVSLLSHMESFFGDNIFITGVVENGNKEALAATNASNAPVNPFFPLHSNEGTSTGMVAIGYDSQGHVVDIQTESAKLLRHKARVFKLMLNSAAKIEDVKVFAIGEYSRSKIQLGFTTTNRAGELDIDGAVGNDGNTAYQVGLIAVGYDDQGQMVEVSGARYVVDQFKLLPFRMVLQSDEQIHDVRVMMEDPTKQSERVPYAAARETNGKTVVSAVLRGGIADQSVDVLAVGYDWQGREVASQRSSYPVSSQEMKTIELTLDPSTGIERVELSTSIGDREPQEVPDIKVAKGTTVTKSTGKDKVADLSGSVDALVAGGKVNDAVAAMKEAVKLDAKNLGLYKKLGKLYEIAGKTGVKLYVNGEEPSFEVAPFIRDGSTLVPFRAIAEALKATVTWNPDERSVTVTRGDATVKLYIDSVTAYVNGKEVTLEVPASIENGSTVMPVRFVSEALNANVQWEAETQFVVINQ